MNVTDIENREYKNPSEILVNLMDKFSDVELSRGEIIEQIMNRAQLEDIPVEQIRQMITDRLKAKGLSDRTIRRALPQELKDTKMQEVRSHRQEYAVKQEEPKPTTVQEIKTEVPVPPVSSIPIVEERLPIVQEDREIVRQEPSATKPVVPPQKREQVIQCPLKVMSKGIAYIAWITVRISIPEHKVKLDPIDRMDIVKA